MAPCVAGAGFQFCHFASVSHISARLIIAGNERDKLIEEEGEKKESADAGVSVPVTGCRGSHGGPPDGRGSAGGLDTPYRSVAAASTSRTFSVGRAQVCPATQQCVRCVARWELWCVVAQRCSSAAP